jgi:hypothetical protein
MTLPVPQLDDRTFEQLVAQARALLPIEARDWVDYNLTDPGITFLELFAWLVDMQLFRVGRVDRRTREAVLRLVGLTPEPARPARLDLWFERPVADVEIPAGSELTPLDAYQPIHEATIEPDDPRSKLIVATTERAFVVRAGIARVLSVGPDGVVDHSHAQSELGVSFVPFGGRAAADELWIEFDAEVGQPELRLFVDLVTEARTPEPPVVAWSGRIGGEWVLLGVPRDGTSGFTERGNVVLALPRGAGVGALRAQVLRGHDVRPVIERLALNVVPARQVRAAVDQHRGTGRPGQEIAIDQVASALEEPIGIDVRVVGRAGARACTRVEDISVAAPHDDVYVRDERTLRFGNGLNGRVPRTDETVVVESRWTRGTGGNAQAGCVWKFLLGGFAGLTARNPRAADGGSDRQTVEDLENDALDVLPKARRAVTAADHSALALDTPDVEIVRAEALVAHYPPLPGATMPGHTTVVIVSRSAAGRGGERRAEPAAVLRAVARHLERYRLLGERIHVRGPDYVAVRVEATLVLADRVDPERVRRDAIAALDRFLSPDGAPDAHWPLGRPIYSSDVAAVLDAVRGVRRVDAVTVGRADASGDASVQGDVLPIGPYGLAVSGEHVVQCERGGAR